MWGLRDWRQGSLLALALEPGTQMQVRQQA